MQRELQDCAVFEVYAHAFARDNADGSLGAQVRILLEETPDTGADDETLYLPPREREHMLWTCRHYCQELR